MLKEYRERSGGEPGKKVLEKVLRYDFVHVTGCKLLSICVETYEHPKTPIGWMAFILHIPGYFWPSFFFPFILPTML